MATLLKITAKDPIRAAVASVPTYHSSLFSAFTAVDEVLSKSDLELDYTQLQGLNDREGRLNVRIMSANEEGGECDNYAVCSWYKLQSGRIEFTVYIS